MASNGFCAPRTVTLGPISLKKYGCPLASTMAASIDQFSCAPVEPVMPPSYVPSIITCVTLRSWIVLLDCLSVKDAPNWPVQRWMFAAMSPPARETTSSASATLYVARRMLFGFGTSVHVGGAFHVSAAG